MRDAFLWSDAWLLQAVVYAARQPQSDLATVLACGDALEHAVFSHQEFSGGARRLVSAGLATLEADILTATPAGLGLVASASSASTLSIVRAAVERALDALPYPSQGPPEPTPFVPKDSFDNAVRSYLSAHHSLNRAGA